MERADAVVAARRAHRHFAGRSLGVAAESGLGASPVAAGRSGAVSALPSPVPTLHAVA
jgi:hypothetical protein